MTYVWGHRGASGYAPENTMEAFELAARQGAYGVELDVQLSADGKLVVCHDYTIDRTSNGSGVIAALPYDVLKQYNYHAGFSADTFYHLPLLEEVLELIRQTGMHLNIELKSDSAVPYEGMEAKVVAAVKEAGCEEQVLYSSFNHPSLHRLRFLAPNAKLGVLYEACLYQPEQYAKTLRANALHPGKDAMRAPLSIDLAHREGLAVNVWTINTPEDMHFFASRGADGLITNYPDVALEEVAKVEQGQQ